MHLIYFLIFFGSFRMKTCLLIFSSSLNCDVECVSHVCSCSFTDGLKPDTKMLLTAASKKKSKGGKGDMTKEDESSKNDSAQPITISLIFKRYVFHTQKKMIQSWGSKRGLWLHLKVQTLKCIEVECVSCPNTLNLFLPHRKSLEARADSVPFHSVCNLILFCSNLLILSSLWCASLWHLRECHLPDEHTRVCILIALFSWITVLKFLLI